MGIISFHSGKDRRENIISGTYQTGTHYIVQTDDCLIEERKCQKIIRTIRAFYKRLRNQVIDLYAASVDYNTHCLH